MSPKGQVTLPIAVRRELGIRPKDVVEIELENGDIRVRPLRRAAGIDAFHRSVPALPRPMTWKEIEEIAHGEHALHVAGEGLGDAQ